MTYTTHGHHIPFTYLDLEERPEDVRGCGGVRLCFTCTMQAARFLPAFSGLDCEVIAERLKEHLQEAEDPDPKYLLHENTAVAVLV